MPPKLLRLFKRTLAHTTLLFTGNVYRSDARTRRRLKHVSISRLARAPCFTTLFFSVLQNRAKFTLDGARSSGCHSRGNYRGSNDGRGAERLVVDFHRRANKKFATLLASFDTAIFFHPPVRVSTFLEPPFLCEGTSIFTAQKGEYRGRGLFAAPRGRPFKKRTSPCLLES